MEIRTAQYLVSSPSIDLCPKADKPEYAFIGRSNVGKSSLINMLVRHAGLAKTSGSPGKTQMINHFVITPAEELGGKALPDCYFVDLPGYGFAKVSQKQRAQWEAMIENYLKQRESLMTVFVLIDSRHKPQQLDLDFLIRLGEWGIPFNMVFTKADKSTQKDVAKNVRSFIDEMRKSWEFIPRSFVTSAEKSLGRREMLAYIGELNHEFYHPEQPA